MSIEDFLSDNNIQGPYRTTATMADACSMLATAMEEESVQTDLAQYVEIGVRGDSGEYVVRWTYAPWVDLFICYPGTQEPSDNYLAKEVYEQFLNGCYHNHYKRRVA